VVKYSVTCQCSQHIGRTGMWANAGCSWRKSLSDAKKTAETRYDYVYILQSENIPYLSFQLHRFDPYVLSNRRHYTLLFLDFYISLILITVLIFMRSAWKSRWNCAFSVKNFRQYIHELGMAEPAKVLLPLNSRPVAKIRAYGYPHGSNSWSRRDRTRRSSIVSMAVLWVKAHVQLRAWISSLYTVCLKKFPPLNSL